MGLEKQYKVCNFELKTETRWSHKQTCQLPHVCSPAVALFHTKGPRHRRKICANSLWLYSYFTQTSPLKNKDINPIFIYLRVFRCLYRGSVKKQLFYKYLRLHLSHNKCFWLLLGHYDPIDLEHKFPYLTILQVRPSGFQITHRVKQ